MRAALGASDDARPIRGPRVSGGSPWWRQGGAHGRRPVTWRGGPVPGGLSGAGRWGEGRLGRVPLQGQAGRAGVSCWLTVSPQWGRWSWRAALARAAWRGSRRSAASWSSAAPASVRSTSWRTTATSAPSAPALTPINRVTSPAVVSVWPGVRGAHGEGLKRAGAPSPRPLSVLTASASASPSRLHASWVPEAGPSTVASSPPQGSCSQGGLCGAPTQVTTSHTQEPRAARVGHGSGGQRVTWLYQGLAGLPAAQAKPISSSPEGATWAGAWGGRARGWVPGLPWRQTTQRPAWCPAGGQSCMYLEGSHPVTPSPGPHQHPPRASRRPRPLGKARAVQAGGRPDTGPGRGGGGGLG